MEALLVVAPHESVCYVIDERVPLSVTAVGGGASCDGDSGTQDVTVIAFFFIFFLLLAVNTHTQAVFDLGMFPRAKTASRMSH